MKLIDLQQDLCDHLDSSPGVVYLLSESDLILAAWDLRLINPTVREDVGTLRTQYLKWRSSPCSLLGGRTPELFASSWTDADDLMDFLDRYTGHRRFEVPTVLIHRLSELIRTDDSLRRLLSWIPEPGWDEVGEKRGSAALAVLCARSFPPAAPRLIRFFDTQESLEPLEEPAVKALAAASRADHDSLIEALRAAETWGGRYSIGTALSRLEPEPRIYKALTELFRRHRDPEDQEVYGYLLADYGDPSALTDLTEAIRRPDLAPNVFHGLKASIERLGGSVPPDVPIPPIPDEDDVFLDSDPWDEASDLAEEGLACLNLGEYDEAEELLSKALDLDPEQWEVGLRLAEIWYRRGEEERARDLARRMIEGLEAEWLADCQDCDAEIIEELQQVADRMLPNSEERRRARFLKYCQGALFFYGAMTVSEMVALVTAAYPEPDQVPWSEGGVLEAIENDPRFVVNEGGVVSHPSVLDPRGILSDRTRRLKLRPRPLPLDAFALAAEGRAHLFWNENEEIAIEGLQDLVSTLPAGPETFVDLQTLMRNRSSPLDVLQEWLPVTLNLSPDYLKGIDICFYKLWNHTYRWDLWGWAPAEVPGAARNPACSPWEGIRVGRNDPCPCGSGKKYKRCCGSVSNQ